VTDSLEVHRRFPAVLKILCPVDVWGPLVVDIEFININESL
jgi:hypothetical protein